jgi:hypothetical protein
MKDTGRGVFFGQGDGTVECPVECPASPVFYPAVSASNQPTNQKPDGSSESSVVNATGLHLVSLFKTTRGRNKYSIERWSFKFLAH